MEVASWVALKSSSVVWHLYKGFFLDVKSLKTLFNVFLRLCWTSHSALPDGFRPLHQRQRHGGHPARSQLASRGEHLHPHVDGIPPHSQHQRTESHGQSACWHLLSCWQLFHPLPICCHVTKGGSFMIKLDVEMKSGSAGRHDDGQTAVINELGWPTC